MRFLHQDFVPIRQFLETQPADMRRLEWELNPATRDVFTLFTFAPKRRPAQPPRPASIDEIAAAFARSGRTMQAGTVLTEYFHVNAPPSERAVSLLAAIEHVEAFGQPTEFLLAGHPEGGIVSVSRYPLPFQDGVPEAKSWAPATRWRA